METSFLPGRVFTGPVDFNAQLTRWLVRANNRQHPSRVAHFGKSGSALLGTIIIQWMPNGAYHIR
ncbi:hypothetical protein Prubr_50380 [Polymorphospora rubra]|uniref:Transposase n=1 Tax=Polymorphospora rubra TaxID=338584 RepID=A0A810N3W0_9ACTN|nr:hypothetical protein Prubr_50380 [Polymorphospora rubra]